MTNVTNDQILQAAQSKRWTALASLGAAAADFNNFDIGLVREPRLLVPVDVQAVVVPAGAAGESMLRLPFRDSESLPALDVHDPGTPREPGVHLLWSVPAALGRGTITDDPAAPGDATRRRLTLPPLPDRWVVLRLAVVSGATDPTVRGWVIEADAATVTPLTDWPATTTNTQSLGTAITREQLTMHVGGPVWAQCYDAALGRLALHDPLDDLANVQLEGDEVSYLVAGWWSQSSDDPLDGIGTDTAYHARLAELGWNDPDHPASAQDTRDTTAARDMLSAAFGVASPSRFTQPVELAPPANAQRGAAVSETLSGQVSPTAEVFRPAYSGFLNQAVSVALIPPAPTRSTLLHGRLHGVPLHGAPAPDARPGADALRVVLGCNTSDLAATLMASGTGMGQVDDDQRRSAERLLGAFSAGLIMRLQDSDVWAEVEEYEHAQGFGSLPGGTEAIDRFVDRPGAPTDPGAGFRPGAVAPTSQKAAITPALGGGSATILWNAIQRPVATMTVSADLSQRVAGHFDARANAVPPTPNATVREVPRPAPRFQFPAAAMVAIAGGGRQLSAVEREEADGLLQCRLSNQVSNGLAGVVSAQDLLASIGSGAVPPEVLDLAREALAEDPYLTGWRTRRASGTGLDPTVINTRVVAEAAVSYSYYAADDARLTNIVATPVTSAPDRQRAVEGLLRLSLSDGVWSHPEGVTMWNQPWRPLFCDWEVTLELGPLAGWDLGGTDTDPTTDPKAAPVTTPDTVTFTGRSPLVNGAARTLAAGIATWLTQERQRSGDALADPNTEAALAALQQQLFELDLQSVALDGVREQLLGLVYDRGLLHKDTDQADDGSRRPTVGALPRLLEAGRVQLTSARLVDAFGRTLDLPANAALVPTRVADGPPATMRLRPRLTAPTRWRFDLVDATSTSVDAALACVDQSDVTKQVNPIAGFLLPDHMDESLEVFATDGTPLGQLFHDPFSDAVTWEIAPGRTDVGPGAGPTDDPDITRHRIGWIAAGLVAADATARQGTPDRPETESALSAMLRAIDTTLWNVDPFGSLGNEHIAGLVGRPIAVVAARLALDVQRDVDTVVYSAPELHDQRAAAYDALAALDLTVRLGELTRADDSLLGYFVDDDYSHFHVVDRVVVANALPSGRLQGVLALDGTSPLTPVPIDHPYVDPAGVLHIHPGQTVRLTLLMHPGGQVNLTSGIVPRIAHPLARDWVQPGLAKLAPSLRTGPLLIDADKVRLPKVASFPAEQLFTRRDTPSSWRDDPILAATQAALLPDTAPEVQEGWVRIDPNPPAAPPAGG